MYEKHIPTPGEYRVKANDWKYSIDRIQGVWSCSTVLRILADERYTGTYIIGKYTVKEIGGTRVRKKDESEWFKIPDHHKPIVDTDLFARANAAIRKFNLPNKQQHDYFLKGKVFCGCCGHVLCRKGKGDHIVYYCRHSQGIATMACYGLEIKAADLEEIVLQTVKSQVAVIGGIDLDSDKNQLSSMKQAEQEKKLLDLQNRKRQLYEQLIRKEITMQDFQRKKREFDYRVGVVKQICVDMRKRADQIAAKYEDDARLKKIAQAANSPEGLPQELAERAVSKVQVFHDNRVEIESSLQDAFAGVDE